MESSYHLMVNSQMDHHLARDLMVHHNKGPMDHLRDLMDRHLDLHKDHQTDHLKEIQKFLKIKCLNHHNLIKHLRDLLMVNHKDHLMGLHNLLRMEQHNHHNLLDLQMVLQHLHKVHLVLLKALQVEILDNLLLVHQDLHRVLQMVHLLRHQLALQKLLQKEF